MQEIFIHKRNKKQSSKENKEKNTKPRLKKASSYLQKASEPTSP